MAGCRLEGRRLPVHLNAIGVAVPPQDVHEAFLGWAETRVAPKFRRLFGRMASRSGIDHRWSVLPFTAIGGHPGTAGGFYCDGIMPGTAARMAIYAEAAPALAMKAIENLGDNLGRQVSLEGITHLVVASCTGFVAPGVDQIIARRLGLSPGVERLLIGFMGCYAGVTALRTASHLVRSQPAARVLVVTVELTTLHLQDTDEIEPMLAMLQFGDGAAAALVTADDVGIAIGSPFSFALAATEEAIRWTITDTGFVMNLSGQVPHLIAEAIGDPAIAAAITGGRTAQDLGWIVHAGGRSILDAVEAGFALPPGALDHSRGVLADHGNMSSATLLFALARAMAEPGKGDSVALAFGPGLAVEGFAFHHAG